MMARSVSFIVGLLAFLAIHAIEVITWSRWFGGAHEAWFLNSGRAIAFTLSCLFAVSVAVGAARLSGLLMAAGAIAAMTGVLLLGVGSTIFPIVLTMGGIFILGPVTLGAWIGREIEGLFRRRR